MDNDNGVTSWWGRFALEEGQVSRWRVGPLSLWLRRLQKEWQIAYGRDESRANDLTEVAQRASLDDPERVECLERFVFDKTPPALHLTPVLADRPVVTRPVDPFSICPGEAATIYVSSPLWMRLETDEANPLLLRELAIQRPSDTWFGRTTMEGELCYASQTHCRLDLTEVPLRPYRALTPVLIVNRANEPLLLERLSLPVVYLSVYAAPNGYLWTQEVTMKREAAGEEVAVELGRHPPPAAGEALRVSLPRRPPEKGGLIRAFTALFG